MIKTKWKSFKDNFRKELKKTPKPKPGDEAPGKKSKWVYFEELEFLMDVMEQRITISNIPDLTNIVEKSEEEIINVTVQEEISNEPYILQEVEQCTQNEMSNVNDRPELQPPTSKRRKNK